MHKNERTRNLIKLAFWSLATAIVFGYAINTFVGGGLTGMYFYKAKADGYAIHYGTVENATPAQPVLLTVTDSSVVEGNQAVPVKKGDLLPANTSSVISQAEVEDGRRVKLEDGQLAVLIPWEVTTSHGVASKESLRNKNIETDPMGGVWNLVMVMLMGLCLGLLGESVTDVMGIKVKKTAHAH
ncbi:MAG: hypothetical protein ACYC1C_15450 [Chloroflexota bacterium]